MIDAETQASTIDADTIDPLHYQWLIGVIARGYRWRHVDRADLMQAGNVGLLVAIQKFDPAICPKFEGHAKHWIRDAIDAAANAQCGPIRVPRRLRQKLRKGKTARYQDLDSRPQGCLRSAAIILNAERADEEMFPLEAKTVAPEEPIDPRWLVDVLMPAVLTSREITVLAMQFGLSGEEPLSCRAIAARIGRTHQRVSQIASGAVAKLRKALAPIER